MAAPVLRLDATDHDGLNLVSAALQDAVGQIGAVTFDPKLRRVTLEINRFRWERLWFLPPQRVRAALAIESVLSFQSQQVQRHDDELVFQILRIAFYADAEPPGGEVRIVLAGGGTLRAQVECLDVRLLDVSAPWDVASRPRHTPD